MQVLTRDDLFRAIAETARAAAKETVSEMDEASKRNAWRSDPGKAAQRMLSEYRRLKIAVKEDIEISEAEGLEMRWQYLKDLMGSPDHALLTEEAAYARERRLQYNQYKIQRIEAAMSMYLRECENAGSEEAMRRYRIVRMRYTDEEACSVEEIAARECVSKRLKSGILDESDWEKIAAAVVDLSRLDIRIDDNPLLTVAEMNAKCRRLDNLGLVVIDYLQLMTSSGSRGRSNGNRQQAVSDMSRMLKIMAKELNVPVICLSQLSRANEKRDNKRPQLSDLRESGAIEQDADIVMFLYREGYYNEEADNPDIAECIVAKNRHGETGKIELRWMPEYTAFATLENRFENEVRRSGH